MSNYATKSAHPEMTAAVTEHFFGAQSTDDFRANPAGKRATPGSDAGKSFPKYGDSLTARNPAGDLWTASDETGGVNHRGSSGHNPGGSPPLSYPAKK